LVSILLYNIANSNFFIQLSFFPAPEKTFEAETGTLLRGLKLRVMDWLLFGIGLFVAGTFYLGAIRFGTNPGGSLPKPDSSVPRDPPAP
jgi:hypothetical protein